MNNAVYKHVPGYAFFYLFSYSIFFLVICLSHTHIYIYIFRYYFSLTLKIFFTFGLAPSLWNDHKYDDMSKSSKARYKMTDLFSMSNIAIASHYWNVGVAMGFLSTPITYYLIDVQDADSALVNQYSALTCKALLRYFFLI